MKVAHRFIGGIAYDNESQSVKRTTETQTSKNPRFIQPSAPRTSTGELRFPSAKALGYFHSSASRTRKEAVTFEQPCQGCASRINTYTQRSRSAATLG